jgi:hypothetical protein
VHRLQRDEEQQEPVDEDDRKKSSVRASARRGRRDAIAEHAPQGHEEVSRQPDEDDRAQVVPLLRPEVDTCGAQYSRQYQARHEHLRHREGEVRGEDQMLEQESTEPVDRRGGRASSGIANTHVCL